MFNLKKIYSLKKLSRVINRLEIEGIYKLILFLINQKLFLYYVQEKKTIIIHLLLNADY